MKKIPVLFVAIGLASLGLTATRAVAQAAADGASRLDEVIISATKRNTRAGDYDGQIGVIGAEEIRSQQIAAIDDLGRSVAGLVFRQRGNRAYDNITLRGQSSIDFYSPKVQVYVDGFVQDQATYGLLMPRGVKQVEVLYGPQGSLYGRGAVGGVLDVVTALPSELPAFAISGNFGNLIEEYNLSAAHDFGAGWAADIAGITRDTEGEYRSGATGAELGGRDDSNVRARLAFSSPGSPWKMTLQASSTDIESSEEQYARATYLRNRIAFPVPNDYDLRSDNYGLKLSYEFDDFALSSLTSHQERDLDRVVFGSYSPETQTTTTQEFRVASINDGQAWSYAGGIYYEAMDFAYSRPAFGMISRQDIEALALFGELTWHASGKLALTFGLRADNTDVKATGIAGGFHVKGDDDSSAVSPKIALGYQLDDDTRVYALYSTGYKAGGFTRLVTPAIASFSYEPETIDNYEIGFKSSFLEDKATVSVAAYFTENDEFQLYIDTAPNQYLQNIGAAESKGIDANLQLFLTERLRSSLSYAWNQAEFTAYNNPLTPGVDYSGRSLPHTPENTLNFTLSYDITLPGQLGKLTPSFQLNHVDEMNFDETGTIGEDEVTLTNLNLAWVLSERYRLDFYASNLGNKTYSVYGFTSAALGGSFYQLGQGFRTGVQLSAEF